MTVRRVPEKHLPGLSEFLRLSDGDVASLVAALATCPLTLNPSDAISGVVSQSTLVANSRPISEALDSLYMGAATSGVTIEEFVEDIVSTLEARPTDELEVNNENRNLLKNRLIAILKVETVGTSVRALRDQFEHGRVYSSSRVVSDVRAVFGEMVDEAPKAAIIVHMLNIHYYEGIKHMDFHVALDTEDIQSLIDSLKRARSKAKTLEQMVEKAAIPLIRRDY